MNAPDSDRGLEPAEADQAKAIVRRSSVLSVIAVASVLVASIVVSALAASGGTSHRTMASTTTTTMYVAPAGVVDLAKVPASVAAEFHYAAAHSDAYRQMSCWCGCQRTYGHRNLRDCFVRADSRWEAHGAGCAVCLAEAAAARQAFDAGTPVPKIAQDLDARYGPPPTTAPTGA